MGGNSGTVEADETFIGGKARNMHNGCRKAKGRGAVGKAVVMGLLERHAEKGKSKVRAVMVDNTKRRTLKPIIQQHVDAGSNVYTDAVKSYVCLNPGFAHGFVDHAEKYVDGASTRTAWWWGSSRDSWRSAISGQRSDADF